VIQLKRLLGNNLVVGKSQSAHPIRQSITRVIQFHNADDYRCRDHENASISLLAENLDEVERHDKHLFKLLRRSLLHCNHDTYYGIRFEISVAAKLIREDIPFVKGESPDFALLGEYRGICIECGSAHISSPTPIFHDLKYKISAVIHEKSKSEYCHNRTALFIDFTNINYHGALARNLPSKEQITTYVKDELQSTDFGSVLLYTYIINEDINAYQWKYTRVDAENVSETLAKYLDLSCPYGEDRTHDYDFLPRG